MSVSTSPSRVAENSSVWPRRRASDRGCGARRGRSPCRPCGRLRRGRRRRRRGARSPFSSRSSRRPGQATTTSTPPVERSALVLVAGATVNGDSRRPERAEQHGGLVTDLGCDWHAWDEDEAPRPARLSDLLAGGDREPERQRLSEPVGRGRTHSDRRGRRATWLLGSGMAR